MSFSESLSDKYLSDKNMMPVSEKDISPAENRLQSENSSGSHSENYTEKLVNKAIAANLHEDPYWHILMHYKRSLFGYKSQIDDPSFFLAENGKYDPKAELEASIRTFFTAINADADNTNADNGHTDNENRPDVCQYIARYDWLLRNLEPDPSKVRILTCEPVDKIKPVRAFLIFPTASINSPASMFGHTFVNIRTTNRNDLLSHAVNYAARTEESNGIAFAFGALMGMYKGDYSVLPYYKKLQEYTDMDRRDIWEYELNLDETELRRMVRHIREMEKVNIDYYFFDDNCAYNILYLLDAARPSLDLAGKSWIFTIPSDTVLDAFDEGVVSGRGFRPSKATKIRQKIRKMDDRLKNAAFEIREGTLNPSDINSISEDRNEKIMVLDLATEILQYDFIDGKNARDDYSKRLVEILKERSRLGKADPGLYDFPAPRPPEKCHRPKRISIGGGGVKDGNGFAELGIRFAYNDVCDPDYSVESGTQIQFVNTRLRYDRETEELGVEQIDLVDLLSLSPRDDFFKPWSWNFRTGFKREITRFDRLTEKQRRELFWQNTGGIGISRVFADKLLVYGLAQIELDTDDSLDYGWSGGSGITSGLIWHVADPYKIMIEGSSIWFGLGDSHEKQTLKTVHRLRLSRNIHLGIDAEKVFAFDTDRTEISAKLDLFF
jgi:hypothetical protein